MVCPLYESVGLHNRRIQVNLVLIGTKESQGNLLKVALKNGMTVTDQGFSYSWNRIIGLCTQTLANLDQVHSAIRVSMGSKQRVSDLF
jgi:hypothetical protein